MRVNTPAKGVDYMQRDRSCSIIEQYLAYLITIKGRSKNTVIEYRLDLLQFFNYVAVEHHDMELSRLLGFSYDNTCPVFNNTMGKFIKFFICYSG